MFRGSAIAPRYMTERRTAGVRPLSQPSEVATPGGLADRIGDVLVTDTTQPRTISLLEEEVHVGKSEVMTDHIQVRTTVEHRDVVVKGDLKRGDLTVERVAVDVPVAIAPEPRHEGDTLIVSVVEERLVVEKRLFVVEEVRITRTSSLVPITILYATGSTSSPS